MTNIISIDRFVQVDKHENDDWFVLIDVNDNSMLTNPNEDFS